jgi:hypothetical protein
VSRGDCVQISEICPASADGACQGLFEGDVVGRSESRVLALSENGSGLSMAGQFTCENFEVGLCMSFQRIIGLVGR